MKKLVLFHRDFQRFTGGQLKVWNYFNHVIASESYEPRIAFTPESNFDETNPWTETPEYLTEWKPETADVLFLAGKDWNSIPETILRDYRKPIINLVQHPRHADPNEDVYGFLSHRAIRICVSQQVADVIKATGKVNGPVFVIPNGVALPDGPPRLQEKDRRIDVLVCGLKAPELAWPIERRFSGKELTVNSLLTWMPRTEYLHWLNNARIAVTLPRPSEGFYLPALEAMASGAIVVCPDCVGNRDFCQDGLNCFFPEYDAEEISAAVERALELPPEDAAEMRRQADTTVAEHSLENERASFLQILERVDEIWGE